MARIEIRCGVCNECFDGTHGYSFRNNKGICPKCKKSLCPPVSRPKIIVDEIEKDILENS